ncbi:MAG: hypothetical protein JXA37_08105 [Chloroflexia bacterium]|nr:hypothetical protein [Chloroflexia bacterium]
MRHFISGFFWGLVLGFVSWRWLLRRQGDGADLDIPLPSQAAPEAGPVPGRIMVRAGLEQAEAPEDDLTALYGIGPVFAQQLQEAGIRSYEQLAALGAEKVSERCGVELGRIQRDDWIGQAQARIREGSEA